MKVKLIAMILTFALLLSGTNFVIAIENSSKEVLTSSKLSQARFDDDTVVVIFKESHYFN